MSRIESKDPFDALAADLITDRQKKVAEEVILNIRTNGDAGNDERMLLSYHEKKNSGDPRIIKTAAKASGVGKRYGENKSLVYACWLEAKTAQLISR